MRDRRKTYGHILKLLDELEQSEGEEVSLEVVKADGDIVKIFVRTEMIKAVRLRICSDKDKED